MSVEQTVSRLGGWATWRELRRTHSRRTIERAMRAQVIIHLSHNRYTLPSTVEAVQHAVRLRGHLSHLSAALHHGWKVKTLPDQTWVTLPRDRGTLRVSTPGIHVHRGTVMGDKSRTPVTGPLRTVIDCARVLPFDEALTVADSALRSRMVSQTALREAAADARGPGSAAVRRVAAHANALAANPLESVLRALTIEVGLVMTPQLQITESGLFAVADLGNEDLRLAIEAEGYETHGTRKGLRRDCCRHTEFAVFGWTSMRYAYEDVMFEQDWARWSLSAWLALRAGDVLPRRPRHILPRAS